jgi:2-C-methyl-D-erythritol 4-phosphate cytidylyltransferase/2-C-methyl-D-erythritol 2,4-cyclodiphosphate synthase
MSCWCILVAAGRSERFGGTTPKLLVSSHGRPLVRRVLDTLDEAGAVDGVVLVAGEELAAAWERMGRPGRKVARVVAGGATRQGSVLAGLAALPDDAAVVLVHDAARAFATPGLFARVAAAARDAGCALPALPVVDTVKRLDGDRVETVPREALRLAQTPQGFRADVLRSAHAAAGAGAEATDDVALVERALASGLLPGVRIVLVTGEESNVKVTRPADLPKPETRIGMGHDVHPLVPGRRFVLGGVDLQAGAAEADRFGPLGHSDGDALVHAACDALLGACGLGDIGQAFPDTSPEHAGRPSLEFLRDVRGRLAAEGWSLVNLSAVVRLERPKIAPHAAAMRAALAEALGVEPSCIGLSAKRGEGLDAVGEGRAVACDCVALVSRS